jgi:membrane protein XagC
MRRALAAIAIAALSFGAVLAIAAVGVRNGLLDGDALRLWAGASTAAAGQVPIGRIVAAYPTLPFLTSTLVAWLTPPDTPAPALVAAALLGFVASYCFHSFRKIGLPDVSAALASLLIAFHPALLRAVIAGPADMFFAVFLLMLCLALYDLRARSGTSEVMAVGIALMALTFSHPMGAAFALAAVPFLAFAVRPFLVANSALNMLVALIFPMFFAIAAFTYVSWVFPGDGWTFLAAPTQSLSMWRAAQSRLLGDGVDGIFTVEASATLILALALGAPVAIVTLMRVRRRQPLVIPAAVFVASAIAATAISVWSGFFGEPSAILVAAPVLAAAVVMRVPLAQERRGLVTALLLVGWFGGLAGVALFDPVAATDLRAAVERLGGERIDALAAGGAAIRSDGVLADIDNAPAFVLGRGNARGILGPQSEPFALAMLFDRIDAPFVAVPDPQSIVGAGDRLDKAFPHLFRDGLRGYRVIYQNNTWRLFARIKDIAKFKD